MSGNISRIPCPSCGMVYNIDLQRNKKVGFRCYGCSALLHYDPVNVSFTEVL